MRSFVCGVLSLLFLVGCSTNSSELKSSVEHKTEQQTEILKNSATVIGRFAETGPLTFCFYELSTKYLMEFCAKSGWQIKNVPGGTYWLGMIKRKNKNTCPTVWHDLQMYFSVKKGEIVYIGDFNFNEHELDHAYQHSDLGKFIKLNTKLLGSNVQVKKLQRTN